MYLFVKQAKQNLAMLPSESPSIANVGMILLKYSRWILFQTIGE